MEQGSYGTQVGFLHSFLCGREFGKGIKFDDEFGKVTKRNLKKFQKAEGLEADGCFGPATRKVAREKYNFDFKTLCEKVNGKMVFFFDSREHVFENN